MTDPTLLSPARRRLARVADFLTLWALVFLTFEFVDDEGLLVHIVAVAAVALVYSAGQLWHRDVGRSEERRVCLRAVAAMEATYAADKRGDR